MNITIRQVDAFLMVAELRSFTAAGAALHITQSAVSNLVKDLEDQIGVQLFDRGRRVVKLAAAGKIFFEKASRAQDVFRSMEQCATELHDARIHRVRIAAAPLLGCTLIPLLAYRFMRRYPEMRVELVDLPMSRVQQAVVDGSADLGYGPARDLEAGVTGELFFETSVHMLSLPQHPLAGEAVSWEQVRKADVIAVGRESIHYISADVGGEEDFHVAHTVHHMATAFALAATGAGIALAGRFSILLARGFGLVATPVYPVLRRAMLLYRPARQELSSPAELFVSFTQEYARRHCLDSLPDDSLTALANTAG